MKTCKDCYSCEICAEFGSEHLPSDLDSRYFEYKDIDNVEQECSCFKDKSKFIELPCRVGDKYYKLKAKCTKMRDCYVYECEECCKNCDKQIYIEEYTYKNAWEILNVYKKEQEEIEVCKSMRWTFTNKEEAETKLRELNEKCL